MQYLVWQLIDSAFPAGGFAHSAGLEAAVQHGHVVDSAGVRAFAAQSLAQHGRSSLPLVTAAHQRPDDMAELDERCDVFLSNPVANRASRAQGRALLASVSRSFPEARVTSLDARARSGSGAAHYAPSFGAVFSLLDICLADTQRAFLFIACRSVSSAAVRLGLIGGYEAQAVQSDVASLIDPVIDACGILAPCSIAQTAPLIDLFQSTHDRLYSRLFQS